MLSVRSLITHAFATSDDSRRLYVVIQTALCTREARSQISTPGLPSPETRAGVGTGYFHISRRYAYP